MKHWPLVLLLFSALLSPTKAPAQGWVPTFADEFNGTDLDLSRWVPHDASGRIGTFHLSSGQLHISAGSISTFGTFAQTFGRFEIRCRVPAGGNLGLKPRFLLLPIPQGQLPGIDVFQTTGGTPSKIYFANRWGTEQTEKSFGDSLTGPDLSDGFHTIAAEWDRDRIVWFIDGKEKFRSIDGTPHQPMYLLLDLATVSGAGSFDIEYVRVFRRP
jgi:beta-glucanase (GH16 family)